MLRLASLYILSYLLIRSSGFHVTPHTPTALVRAQRGTGLDRKRTVLFGLKPWQIGNVPLPGGNMPKNDGPNPFDPTPEVEEDDSSAVSSEVSAAEASEVPVTKEAASVTQSAPVEEAPSSSKAKAFGKGGKKKKGKKKAAASIASAPQQSNAALAKLVELENELHVALGETEKGGVVAQPKDINDRVSGLVGEIEGIADMQLRGEELVYALVGDWELRYTDNEAFIKSKGITGTAALPFCNLEAMWQRISTVRPTAQLVEIVKIFGGKQLVVLKGDCSLLDMTILDAGFEEIEVNGGNNVPQRADGYRLQLRCTFVGDKVWIGRSASNAVFAWRRRASGDLEEMLKTSMK